MMENKPAEPVAKSDAVFTGDLDTADQPLSAERRRLGAGLVQAPPTPEQHADADAVTAEQEREEQAAGVLVDREAPSYGHLLCRARLREVISHPGQDHDNGARTVTLGAEFLQRLRRALAEA